LGWDITCHNLGSLCTGLKDLAKGTAKYLMQHGTAATTLAVYGSWGSGKVRGHTIYKSLAAAMGIHIKRLHYLLSAVG